MKYLSIWCTHLPLQPEKRSRHMDIPGSKCIWFRQSNDINRSAEITSKLTSSPFPACPLCSFLALWALIFLLQRKMRALRTSALKAGIDSEDTLPGSKIPKWCCYRPLSFCQSCAAKSSSMPLAPEAGGMAPTCCLTAECSLVIDYFLAWDECHWSETKLPLSELLSPINEHWSRAQ